MDEKMDWTEKLASKPVPEHGFNEKIRARVLSGLSQKQPMRNRRYKAWVGGGVAVAVVVTLLLSGVIQLPSDQNQHSASQQESQVVTDEQTRIDIPTVTANEKQTVLNYKSDDMDRGDHNYSKAPVVIDSLYYQTHDVQRGEVVYVTAQELQPDLQKRIARVVALPGEKVKIEAGQVFINGKQLNTFYGHEYKTGEYVTNSPINLPEMTVAAGTYYVLSDNWWRVGLYRQTIPQADFIGKVLGYSKQN